MEYAIAFVILLVIYGFVWLMALGISSAVVGGLDFGSLGLFALKSAGLVAIVALVMLFVPLGGWLALLIWWLGAVFICRMEFWEAKVLVLIAWGLSFLLRLALLGMLISARGGK